MEKLELSFDEKDEVPFDRGCCILCQKKSPSRLTGTSNGRKRICEMANEKNDVVSKRLRMLEPEPEFLYHMNNECYKRYTMKKSPAKSAIASESDSPTRYSKRGDITPRASKSWEDKDLDRSCVICCKIKHGGEIRKSRISEKDCADKLIKCASLLQDDVFVRICDLQDAPAIFAADIYYHKTCMKHYTRLYERKIESSKENDDPTIQWNDILVEVKEGLNNGMGYEISSIRDNVNEKLSGQNHTCQISNKQVQRELSKVFGHEIVFSKSKKANQSLMVYSANACPGTSLAEKVRSIDPIVECASQIRSALLNCDFDLDDRFCDSNDLEYAWLNQAIPSPLLKFFATLFNFSSKDFEYSEKMGGMNTRNTDEEDKPMNSKVTRMKSLFQVIFYILHNGRKRTPLHIMNSQALHETCKSRTLMTSFNRYGLCSSYDDALRLQTGLANYIAGQDKDDTPLPSNFNPETFTTAAFDNFDHEEATLSGKEGCHDTVTVLFQEDRGSRLSKPRPSEVGIAQDERVFKSELKCQQLKAFQKPTKKPNLPEDYEVAHDFYKNKPVVSEALEKDFAWSLARLNIDKKGNDIDIFPTDQCTPSWTGTNALWSTDSMPKTKVGFLPVLPYPVTRHDTVYTAMKNLQDILTHLKQSKMAIACDEGVYRIAREIQLLRPTEFDNIVLCLGTFHMAKVALVCIGKYLKNSGAEDIFVESGVFGVNVVESSVMSGKHYTRSLKGFQLLNEALTRLKMKEYMAAKGIADHQDTLNSLEELKQCLAEKKTEECGPLLNTFFNSGGSRMLSQYQSFIQETSEKDETFRYWNTFGELFNGVQNLIRSDREANWELHLSSVQTLLPLFAAFDSINYLRWCSLYLEDMRRLPNKAPEIYKAFCDGGFVVKRVPGKFRSVGMDMALEQTINRSQKDVGGIIGNTRQKSFVAKWELVYHELLSISNLQKELAGSCSYVGDVLNHELNNADTVSSERNVQSLLNVMSKRGNPFSTEKDDGRLHNIMTRAVGSDEVRKDILNVIDIGCEKYEKMRTERFIKKTAKLSDTIHRTNLKTFKTTPPKQNEKNKLKDNDAHYQRSIEISLSRGESMEDLLKYDVSPESYLFDKDEMMKKSNKSTLMQELEKRLPQNADKREFMDEQHTTSIVDVMAVVRKGKPKGTFGDLCEGQMSYIISSTSYAQRIDLVFDSYMQNEVSIKDGERQRRQQATPIELADVTSETKLPIQMETFWPSNSNKDKLEALLHKCAMNTAKTMPDVHVIASHMIREKVDLPCMQSYNGMTSIVEELSHLSLEEADDRIIAHALHAVKQGTTRIVVISVDTDVFVLLLFYWKQFSENGLKELWQKAGVGDSTRYIPLHTLASCVGEDLCQVLPAIHTLTGCDYTSKIGTKYMALKTDATLYLKGFGKDPSLSKTQMAKCEEYLVQVLKPGCEFKTMDDLRIRLYFQSKVNRRSSLPPTSHAVSFHIKRALFATYRMMSIIDADSDCPDPTNYGYINRNDSLVAEVGRNSIPDQYTVSCKCERCSTDRCPCLGEGSACCRFCSCNFNEKQCLNPISLLR